MRFRARDADAKCLTRLAHVVGSLVTANDPIGIRYDFPVGCFWPTLEDNHFIELLAFSLVHIHYNHAGLRLVCGREVFLYERRLNDGKCIAVRTERAPVLSKRLSQLCPPVQEPNIFHFLAHFFQSRTMAGF